MAPNVDDDPRASTIAELESIIRNLPDGLAPGVLAGEPVMVAQGFALLEADGQRLGTWTMLLLGLTILICFRSLRWLIVPIAVVQWTLVVTRALLVVSGLQLSMVSSMLTAIVTVVGVATRDAPDRPRPRAARQGLAPRDALLKAAVLLAGPILGAVLTDVAGFGSLWWASVEPVRDFGTMMVVGSLLVLPAICLLVPALALAWRARHRAGPSPAGARGNSAGWLMRSVDADSARPRDRGRRHRSPSRSSPRSARCGWRSKPTSPATSAAAAGSSRRMNSSKRNSAARACGTS